MSRRGVRIRQKICVSARIDIAASQSSRAAGQRAHRSRREDRRTRELDGHFWGWVHSRATHDASVSCVGVFLEVFCHVLCRNYQASIGRRVVRFAYVQECTSWSPPRARNFPFHSSVNRLRISENGLSYALRTLLEYLRYHDGYHLPSIRRLASQDITPACLLAANQ